MSEPAAQDAYAGKRSKLEDAMQAQLDEAGLGGYAIEVTFHPTRRWRLDFAWINQRVALEVEGGTYIRGGHSHPTGIENDCIKNAEAAIMGWCVIRATGHMVKDGRALELVRRALDSHRGADR